MIDDLAALTAVRELLSEAPGDTPVTFVTTSTGGEPASAGRDGSGALKARADPGPDLAALFQQAVVILDRHWAALTGFNFMLPSLTGMQRQELPPEQFFPMTIDVLTGVIMPLRVAATQTMDVELAGRYAAAAVTVWRATVRHGPVLAAMSLLTLGGQHLKSPSPFSSSPYSLDPHEPRSHLFVSPTFDATAFTLNSHGASPAAVVMGSGRADDGDAED